MMGSSFFSRIVFTVSAILVFICLFVAALNYFKFERLLLAQQSRVMRVTAHDLAETLERSINLGVRLMNVADAQVLLDRNWTGNRGISMNRFECPCKPMAAGAGLRADLSAGGAAGRAAGRASSGS